MKLINILIVLLVLVRAELGHAWGKRGHAMVAENAAYLLDKDSPQLKLHSFDLEYYANVPDMIWKRPATYGDEKPQHYADLEIFHREMNGKQDWISDRALFFKTYPKTAVGGFSFWRISELCGDLEKIHVKLNSSKITGRAHQEEQMKWLSLAGIIGHYIGDLAQPLHVTENFDGQLTDQKGLHAFYESDIVDELYPDMSLDVTQAARTAYGEIKNKKNMSCFDIARELAHITLNDVPDLLARDKKVGRANIKAAAAVHRKAIVTELGRGAAYLAVLWSKYSDWPYDGDKFYDFDEHPKYIKPAK